MASLLVVIELVGDRVHPASLEALGEARRLGSALGAAVYTVVTCVEVPGVEAPGEGEADPIAVLSRHGADKVLLVPSPRHRGSLRWGGHGPSVVAVCQLVRPLMVFVAGTHGGRDLTGRLASRLGAGCLVDAALAIEEDRLIVWEGSGDQTRRLDPELDFSLVLQTRPGRYDVAVGEEEAAVEIIEAPGAERDFVEVAELPGPCVAVAGEGEHLAALAAELGADRTSGIPAPLVIGTPDRIELRASVGATCVAVGDGAADCEHAHYALEGDADFMADMLIEALRRGLPGGPSRPR